MPKSELSNLMKDIWAAKAQSDGEIGRKQLMAEFLYDFFMKRFNGIRDLVSEWAYSMQDALEKYQDEDNVKYLRDVLNNEANEEFYYHHMEVIKNLIISLQNTDPENTGIISPADFHSALGLAYPLKSEEKLEELLQACLEELNETKESAVLKYMDLFTEDEEGHTGPLLTKLRNQENEEIAEYVKDVGEQLQGAEQIGMMRLREAFMVVDPEIKHGQMIQHLRLCFKCSSDQLDDIEPLDASMLLQKMAKSGIYRQGKRY